jgi:hypothetical protein
MAPKKPIAEDDLRLRIPDEELGPDDPEELPEYPGLPSESGMTTAELVTKAPKKKG